MGWNIESYALSHLNSYLFTYKFTQAEFELKRSIMPQSFNIVFALIGGFWGVCFNLGTWLLRRYVRFQFYKNQIKDLYFYSRTKKMKE